MEMFLVLIGTVCNLYLVRLMISARKSRTEDLSGMEKRKNGCADKEGIPCIATQ